MGGKALPIRLIKFLIIHLHSTGIPPPPHFLSTSLSLSFPFFPFSRIFSLSLAPFSHCWKEREEKKGEEKERGRDPFNIFLNYIFNGRNKWIIDCFTSLLSANRVIINALLQFSHSYKYIIQSIAERIAEISGKMQFASCKIIHVQPDLVIRSRRDTLFLSR